MDDDRTRLVPTEGAELDAWLCEHALGWTKQPDKSWRAEDGTVHYSPPCFSTSLDDVLKYLEPAMAKRGWMLGVARVGLCSGRFEVGWDHDDVDRYQVEYVTRDRIVSRLAELAHVALAT